MYFDVDSAVKTVAAFLGDEFVATKKIQAIKLVRSLSNESLKESKDAVEAHTARRRYYTPAAPHSTRANRIKALAQISNAVDELRSHVYDQADDFADEPNDGAVIMFTHQYGTNGTGKVYTFVAMKRDGGWYLTGSDKRHEWKTLQQQFRALRSASTFQHLS